MGIVGWGCGVKIRVRVRLKVGVIGLGLALLSVGDWHTALPGCVRIDKEDVGPVDGQVAHRRYRALYQVTRRAALSTVQLLWPKRRW